MAPQKMGRHDSIQRDARTTETLEIGLIEPLTGVCVLGNAQRHNRRAKTVSDLRPFPQSLPGKTEIRFGRTETLMPYLIFPE
jgi:hypothetical protein